MKRIFIYVSVFVGLIACGPKLSKEIYVQTLSDMGCKMAMESTPEGIALLKEKGITQEDINEFRKKSNVQEMMDVSHEIAAKVAACHGVSLP